MGGLLTYPFEYRGDAKGDIDLIDKPGVYGVNMTSSAVGTKNSPVDTGMLIVCNSVFGAAGGGSPLAHIIIPSNATGIYVHFQWVSKWSPWRMVTLATIE